MNLVTHGQTWLTGTYTFGDRTTSDIIVRLRNRESRPEWFYCHSSILSRESKFFAEQLSKNHSTRLSLHSDNFIEIHCADSTYDHYVKLLSLFYLSQDLVLESWESVRTALGVLQAAIALGCEEITQSCIKYLESVPWEDKEEEQLVKIVSTLGEVAMPILARVQPVDLNATKKVFISAIQFATSTNDSCPPFGDELKTSAQEQIEYMLVEDDDTALVTADEEVKSEVQAGLSKMFSMFEIQLGKLSSLSDSLLEAMEKEVIQRLMDLDWICNILTKIGMMKEFVISWTNISLTILSVVQNENFCSGIWGVKLKVVEVTGKVLDAVGYGNVILPASSRSELLKTWLPFIRMVKPLLDTKAVEDESFEHKLDDELSQNIEHSIISLVLALPSNDQAEILLDWMKGEQVRYPDLSEAFEVWCYRTKAAKRRLMLGFSDVGNATVSLE